MGRPSDLHATTPPKLARVIASRGGRTATALQTQSERGQGLSYKLFVRPSHRMASPSLQLLFLTSLLASLALTSNAKARCDSRWPILSGAGNGCHQDPGCTTSEGRTKDVANKRQQQQGGAVQYQ